MDIKRDILWRVYLGYIAVVLLSVAILGKAFYIQQVQGKKWRSMSDSLHQKIEEVDAERGTIYSEDGQMLSTSIPQFDVFIDFGADGLREKNGKRFKENIDSLSFRLAELFKDKSAGEYKKILQQGYKDEDRYFPLRKNISYREYQELKTFPLVRLGKNKSGFIEENKSIRLNPYKLLAFRTIGLARDSFKVGLEMTYDSILKGKSGNRLVRYIAGGVGVPVDDVQVEPENGKDIVSTIDVFVQEITENALMRMMMSNEADHGCAIVMETKTGKVKAIANLGKRTDGSYFENFNYAINATEPGSTFKLVTLMSLLEDKKVSLNQIVNVQNGVWQTAGQTVYDDDDMRGKTNITVKQAFEFSSNVGMAKLATMGYSNNPGQFLNHIKRFRMDTLTGIDLTGERKPVIIRPGSRLWGPTTLPWMAFGYNLQVTPLQTISLYNAIANNGTMMHPYLVSAVKKEGETIREFEPRIAAEKICSDETLKQIKQCLEGVCTEGTARKLFVNSPYRVGGKTGTALVANGSRGYADQIFQSSFVGFFPVEDPQYTILVVIVNKPHVVNHFGASVAGPVFKEIADRLYATYVHKTNYVTNVSSKKDSSSFSYIGSKDDAKQLMKYLQIKYTDSSSLINDWINVNGTNGFVWLSNNKKDTTAMPSLRGMGLKDAVYLCENIGLKVNIKGKGKVAAQSIITGQPIARGQVINIQLN
jgi:cell division protein FtsI (penicillin-binding protein 3)